MTPISPLIISPPPNSTVPMVLGRTILIAPKPLTLTVVGPVLVREPTLNRTPKPLVNVNPGGIVEGITKALAVPVESAPANIIDPPCPGEIGVVSPVNAVMSELAPACAALVRQVMIAL